MGGKNINYFLMDEIPNGRIKCTISNWTGVVYRIPRTELESCKGRKDLKQSGVYFLFGIDENTDKPLVYVGQAGIRKSGEGILNRLQEHRKDSDKDYYWTEAVVFTTSNNSFGHTEISWLENHFRNLAVDCKRYIVKNSNEPNVGNPTEEKQSELEEFASYAKIVMGVLGHNLFESLDKTVIKTESSTLENSTNNSLLYMKRKSRKSGALVEVSATGFQTSEGFVVKAGSIIETIDSDTIPPTIKMARQSAKVDENGSLEEDFLTSSPSYAAAFVVGGHANGRVEWKNADGITLNEIEEKSI